MAIRRSGCGPWKPVWSVHIVRMVLTWRDLKEQGKTGALISTLCCEEVGEVEVVLSFIYFEKN